ncbi:MAG: SH3 domain-containing protein [Alkalibacterium sp.]
MSKRIYLTGLALFSASMLALSGCEQDSATQEPASDTEEVQEEESEETSEQNDPDTSEDQDEAGSDETDSEDEEEQTEEEPEEEQKTVSIFGNQENRVYISENGVNVRADSSEESESLGRLIKGNEVTVIDEVEEEETTWYQISHHNTAMNEGWVSSDYTVSDMNELHSSTAFDNEELNAFFTSPELLEENRVVAYYGHPNSEVMGIVGRHPVGELIDLLEETTATYDEAD